MRMLCGIFFKLSQILIRIALAAQELFDAQPGGSAVYMISDRAFIIILFGVENVLMILIFCRVE